MLKVNDWNKKVSAELLRLLKNRQISDIAYFIMMCNKFTILHDGSGLNKLQLNTDSEKLKELSKDYLEPSLYNEINEIITYLSKKSKSFYFTYVRVYKDKKTGLLIKKPLHSNYFIID